MTNINTPVFIKTTVNIDIMYVILSLLTLSYRIKAASFRRISLRKKLVKAIINDSPTVSDCCYI